MRKTTTAAAVAKLIRAEMKQLGIPARVTSSNYAGGDAVHVDLGMCLDDSMLRHLHIILRQYQYGDFDGMRDAYDYDNVRDDIPQVRYVHVFNGR